MQKLLDGIGERVEESIGEQIKAGLERYNDEIKRQIDIAQAAVNKRFEMLASIMLGEDRKSEETLTEAVRRWREGHTG